MLTTDQKGAIAETAIVLAAVRLGVDVYRPLSDGGRYDLIFDVGERLLRIQCKTAAHHGDVLAVPCYSARRSPNGFSKRRYTVDEVDAIAAYSPDLDKSYLLFLERFGTRTSIQLRLVPARNNQRTGINWADDFAFDATLTSLLGP